MTDPLGSGLNGQRTSTGPIILLSYLYSGAEMVQRTLARDTDLACTAGTGILPMCEAVAETWIRVEGRPGRSPSRLAQTSIRSLVSLQLNALLLPSGRRRWCELALAPASTAAMFLRIFPESSVVCVHRRCIDTITAAAAEHPWGLAGSGLAAFIHQFPGNTAAAAAAYWISATEQLLELEAAHQQVHRVRYEDVEADAQEALAPISPGLRLVGAVNPWPLAPVPGTAADEVLPATTVHVPVQMIPNDLRGRVEQLQQQLGYSEPT